MMKLNATHVHAFHENIKALNYFRFAAEGLIFFLHIVGKPCRKLV